MTPLRITPLHPMFGAELSGFDPAAADEAAFREAIGVHGLVLIRAEGLDDEVLAAFAGRFGPLQNMSGKPGVVREVIRVSNLDDEGRMKAAQDPARMQHDANLLWHADSSFMAPGAAYSFLHARIVPAEGGDTEFLDARVAWEALAPGEREALRPLTAEHSMLHSWRLVGVEMPPSSRASLPPVVRRLVRRHGASGREALVIPSHVQRIEGRDDDGSMALMGELTAVAAAPERVYRHRWRAGDLLVWDNRCILHRATPYAAFEEPRDLRSCRVVDVGDDGLAAVR